MNLAAEKPSAVFYDRRGNIVTAGARPVIKPRTGIFALALAGRVIALTWQKFANGIADLPGGGIDEGETPDKAIRREWGKEAGLPFDLQGPVGKEFRHVCGFYAEDWVNPEGDQVGWESIDNLPNLRVNRAHWCGIMPLLAQIDIRMAS